VCPFQYIKSDVTEYDNEPPFHPPQNFPEYQFENLGSNDVYTIFRQLLHSCGLDDVNYDTPEWNPLGSWVKQGYNVLIKPNLVIDSEWLKPNQLAATIVHGSFLRPLVDYCLIALGGKGQITIADGPVDIANFDNIVKETGISDIVNWYRQNGHPVQLFDMRPERLQRVIKLPLGKISVSLMKRKALSGDPKGYGWVKLDSDSSFQGLSNSSLKRLRSIQQIRPRKGPSKINSDGKHMYPIARTTLQADCLISVAKLKSHKKIGVTLGLKNMVGVILPRFWLAHYREGAPPEGDENAPSLSLQSKLLSKIHEKMAISGYMKVLFSTNEVVSGRRGSWSGNDTLWRVALDLLKCVLFSNKLGKIMKNQQRQYLSIVDGIVSGEFDGPLNPTPKPTGIIVLGSNPLAVDTYCR
ncbi:MAG: DUF362 domain-containing protein, partial [Candidatus Thorarchaeota archaeon]|nr:DUF362 domain-containing protein [Candidatus Thorarchaeota archaeon]